jgi:hypothetical protein
MKREILCPACAAEMCKAFPDNPYPGEHVKFQGGKAKSDYRCDQCGEPINAEEDCACMSIWADYGGGPYYPWEKEFIESL